MRVVVEESVINAVPVPEARAVAQLLGLIEALAEKRGKGGLSGDAYLEERNTVMQAPVWLGRQRQLRGPTEKVCSPAEKVGHKPC